MEDKIIFDDDRVFLTIGKIKDGITLTLCLTWPKKEEQRIQKLAMDNYDAFKLVKVILDTIKDDGTDPITDSSKT